MVDCSAEELLDLNPAATQSAGVSNKDQDQSNKRLVFHLNEYLNSETLSHRRRKNFAPKELNIIISMVEENADLIYNRVNKNPKFMSKQEFWQTVTNMINENCHFAAQRDVKEVRRKWVTFQSEVKSKAREGTHLLNVHEKRVHDLIQLHSQISEGTTPSAEQEQRLTMLPTKDHSPLVTEPEQVPTPAVLEQISQNNSPASSLSSNTSFGNTPQPVKIENVTDTELLMNICSQVMGLAPGDISAQMDGAIKDIIAKPIPVSKVASHSLTSTASSVTPVLSPANGTPTRNVVSVQPVNHVQTPPKRPRLDATPTNGSLQNPLNNSLTNTLSKLADNAHALNGESNGTEVTTLLREMVEQQRLGNKIAEDRLAVERQRRDLEQEKVEIERARYEIEKERLCQEIISRKKP